MHLNVSYRGYCHEHVKKLFVLFNCVGYEYGWIPVSCLPGIVLMMNDLSGHAKNITESSTIYMYQVTQGEF